MRQKGFTLLEVMAVVALVAIVSTFAIPMMRNLLVQSALTATANDVAGSLASARSNAVREARQFVVRPRSGAWANGWCVVRGTADNCESVAGNVISLTDKPNSSVVFKSGPAANPTFERNGVISSIALGATASVLICEKNGSKSRQIIFSRSGTVTIKKDASGC